MRFCLGRCCFKGFEFSGRRVPLLSQQGIFKPAVLPEIPLSIRTSPKGPYDDSFGPDQLLHYAYRGTDPNHPENVGLRRAIGLRTPLIYFHGVVPGRYLAAWPAFVVRDMPSRLRFGIALDDPSQLKEPDTSSHTVSDSEVEGRRIYVTSTVRRRLHQQGFRERVLRAYKQQCTLCRLKHAELLDAAHIIADSDEGDPVVPNGLSLCKLHHAAYDRHFVSIRPDYRVEIRPDILEEIDGPMLRHGLKELHGIKIRLPGAPKNRPDPERLRIRYETYLSSIEDPRS